MKSLWIALAVAGCSKSASAPKTKWIDLTPLPLQIQVPDYATVGQQDLRAVIVSARACVVLVEGSEGRSLKLEQTRITTDHPDAVFSELTDDYFAVTYASDKHKPLKSFRLIAAIEGATYWCSPFAGRADVACELAACKSLRAKPAATAPAGP